MSSWFVGEFMMKVFLIVMNCFQSHLEILFIIINATLVLKED